MAVFYTPFLIAFIISAMVEPLIRFISKKTKMQRKPSAVIVIIAVFAIIVSLLVWGIAVLIDEGANLLKMLNEYVGNGYEYIMNLIDKLNFDEIQISEEVLNITKNSAANLLDQISKWVSDFITSILTAVTQIGTVRNIHSSHNPRNILHLRRQNIHSRPNRTPLPKSLGKKTKQKRKKNNNLTWKLPKSPSNTNRNKLRTSANPDYSHSKYLG